MAVHLPGFAMRSVFWLLGLAALAVALALLMGHNQAMVTLFWFPYRYDVAFNFVVFALIVVFALMYLALRAVAVLRELPAQARRWRHQQVERAAVGAVLDALAHQLAGRFVRAQAAGLTALEQLNAMPAAQWAQRPQLQLLAHLLVAESAQSLQNHGARDQHLQAALHPQLIKAAPVAHEGALLRSVHWALEERDADLARSRLAELPHGTARRIQALRLKLRAARLGGATAEALDTARLLAKHRAFSPQASHSILRSLALAALRETRDLSQLRTVWSRLDAKERLMPELALAAGERAHQLAQAEGRDAAAVTGEAAALVRGWLEPLWPGLADLTPAQQRQLVLVMEPGLPSLDASWLARLEQTQQQWPSLACLQYLAGQAFMQRQLWGKAALLLGQASHSLNDPVLLRRTWCALARLAEERGDATAAQAAWKRAALLA